VEKGKGSNPKIEKKGRFKVDEGKGGRGGMKLEVSVEKGDTMILPRYTPGQPLCSRR